MKIFVVAILTLMSFASVNSHAQVAVGAIDLICKKDGLRADLLYVGNGVRSEETRENSRLMTEGMVVNIGISEGTVGNAKYIEVDQILYKSSLADYYDLGGGEIGRFYTDKLHRQIERSLLVREDGSDPAGDPAHTRAVYEKYTAQLAETEAKVLNVGITIKNNGFLDFNEKTTNYTLTVRALHKGGLVEMPFTQDDCVGVVGKMRWN